MILMVAPTETTSKFTPATLKPLFSGAGVYIGIGFLHLCAQSQEAFHMLINGAGCKITATGQSHPRPPKAAKLSPDEVIRRPNAPYQSWVRLHIAHIGTVNFTVSWDLWQRKRPFASKYPAKYVHRIYPHFST